jgi:hypothetical protein
MKVKTLFAAGLLLLAPLSAPAAVELGVKGTFWFPRLSGDFDIGTGIARQTGDFEDRLGFDDESVLVGEVFLQGGSHRLSLSGTRFDYKGRGGSLDYNMLDLVYEWLVIDLENVLAGFSLGPALQVKYVSGDLDVDPVVPGAPFVRENFEAPVPLVGLALHVGLLKDLLEARGRAAGMGFRGNSIVDAYAELSFNPLPFIELVGGYRHLELDLDANDFVGGDGNLKLDLTQTGPYLGLALKVGI